MLDKEKSSECLHTVKKVRTEALKHNVLSRLNCIEGQVRGIKRMIEEDTYCDDVLNQICSVRSALGSVAKLILEDHIRGCFINKIRNGEDEIVDELLTTVGKML